MASVYTTPYITREEHTPNTRGVNTVGITSSLPLHVPDFISDGTDLLRDGHFPHLTPSSRAIHVMIP